MSATEEFFKQLQGPQSMLSDRVDATMRIDVDVGGAHTQHWYLEMKRGEVRTTRDNRDADCVLRGTREVFDRITSGESGLVAALVRNDLVISGEVRLFTVLRKLVPSPPGATDPRALRQRQ